MNMMYPKFSVEGKVAIITGSSQGIGNALARGFGKAGASVVLVARSADRLKDAARKIESEGGKALAVPTDVTDGLQVTHMVEQVVDTFGRIDVLINCAGGSAGDRFIPLLDMEEESWDRVMDRNLRSIYLCCRAAGRFMVNQKNGSVINISSGSAVIPTATLVHYCAAKSGVNQFTRALALEWAPHNVRVNVISPGMTDTAGEREHMPQETMEKYTRMIPLGRIGQPEDMLGAALFLASEASNFVTGVILPVSGGPQ
jgi:NAD(P)-dependent dehydrogenase (short-subunit alcohol dehydrogenase family)